MKPQIRVAFAAFWPGFQPDLFRRFFPFVYDKYDLVVSDRPEVAFHSVFAPGWRPYGDPTHAQSMPTLQPGDYLRVFITGENVEPDMGRCDFAISFSTLLDHPRHLRLPLWVYENRLTGFTPASLVKDPSTDWEAVARAKTKFCNYVYSHGVAYRDRIFDALCAYKAVDSAGPHRNSLGWTPATEPTRLAGKVAFLRDYRFTLSLENTFWPGYETEKLVDPIYAASVPIYAGDPAASARYNPDAFIDLANFPSLGAMIDYVRAVDDDPKRLAKMLAAPFYRDNAVPEALQDAATAAFFDRIFETAIARRSG